MIDASDQSLYIEALLQRLTGVLVVLLPVLAACSVDLERDESLLLIRVDHSSPQADRVVVEVRADEDGEPFQVQFPVRSCLSCAATQTSTSPEISLPSGLTYLAARSVDANGFTVDGPVAGSFHLFPGPNVERVDFAAISSLAQTAIFSELDVVEEFETRFDGSVETREHIVAFTDAIEGAIQASNSTLSEPATVMRAAKITIVSLPSSAGTRVDLRQIWSSHPSASFLGAVNERGQTMTISDDGFTTKVRVALDLTHWLNDPMLAEVRLQGPSSLTELPELVRIQVRLILDATF